MNAVSMPSFKVENAYRDIFEQFVVDGSFLWILRSLVVNSPHYTRVDIETLDARIEAQVDGLMTAPEEAWSLCHETMDNGDAGDCFVGSVVAFRSLDVAKIQRSVELGLANERTFPGLVSALGWLPGRLCHSWIKRFLTSKDIEHKYMALAVCSIRREDPADYLTKMLLREDCLAHPKLYARALRLIGELKRHDLMPALRMALRSDNKDIRFWSIWSSILLGDKTVLPLLKPYVLESNPHQDLALQLGFRSVTVEEARSWISALSTKPDEIRNVIKATAALGDPQAIPWLISKMASPSLTRLTGEAFTTITGIDLVEHGLAIKDLPNLDEQLPNDDPSDNRVAMDEDEDLPFPDAGKVAAVWERYRHRLAPGTRYLLGKPLDEGHLSTVLITGYQRQRHAAAMELSLLQPNQILINCAARELANE